jgi:hypothetical protein
VSPAPPDALVTFGWYLTSNIQKALFTMVKIINFSIAQNLISTTNNQGSSPGPSCRQRYNIKMTLNSKKAGQGLKFD